MGRKTVQAPAEVKIGVEVQYLIIVGTFILFVFGLGVFVGTRFFDAHERSNMPTNADLVASGRKQMETYTAGLESAISKLESEVQWTHSSKPASKVNERRNEPAPISLRKRIFHRIAAASPGAEKWNIAVCALHIVPTAMGARLCLRRTFLKIYSSSRQQCPTTTQISLSLLTFTSASQTIPSA